MKTDDLIDLLATHVEPADPRRATRVVVAAVAAGAVAVVIAVLATLGLRVDGGDWPVVRPIVSKAAFALALLVPAAAWLVRLTRPGPRGGGATIALVASFVAIVTLAVAVLWVPRGTHWHATMLGDEWLECLISIPVIAVVPFAFIVWAVRQAAPTDLRATGAAAGFVAGSLSAAGYALHCVDDSAQFVALWYGGTIAICTIVGYVLGPRLLRW